MNNKNLILLGSIAVLMIIWAVVQSRISNRPNKEQHTNTYLIQGLDPDDIGSIVVKSKEDMVTLKHVDNSFVITDKDDYPAVSDEINTLITSCLDIRTSELYTDNPENFKDLGVTEEDAQNVIKFLKEDLGLITGIIIGNTKERGEGTFVRLVSNNNVYVTLKTPWIKNKATNYLDQELISIHRDDIESVTINLPKESYSLKEDNETKNIVLDNLPEGKKLNESAAASVFTALSNLRFFDVKRNSSLEKKLNFDKQFICKLKNSTAYTINIAHNDDKTFITCTAEFTDKTPVVKEKGTESEEELKRKESILLAHEKAEAFQARHHDWVYEISEYNATNLTKERSALFEAAIDANEENTEKETSEDKKPTPFHSTN
ncbi:MAG: DUF4340 domain-containing protein [Candidatus Brocadiaceae bacterium]|nr:DUF4340 domain-containing protein [Candidatus Brocadiaceae bacterium]